MALYHIRAGWLGRRAYLLLAGEWSALLWTIAGNGTPVYEVSSRGDRMTIQDMFLGWVTSFVLRAAAA